MTILLLEQSLNGLQLGLMLFLFAAGLTLVFGIMDMINLAHGSLYMIGAYIAAAVAQASGSFLLGSCGGCVWYGPDRRGAGDLAAAQALRTGSSVAGAGDVRGAVDLQRSDSDDVRVAGA